MDPTPDLLASLLPPAALEWLHAWGPTILALLVVTSIVVPLVLPLARRLETWAIATPATWDDGPATALVHALEVVLRATRWVLALVPRLTIGEPSQSSSRRPPTLPVLLIVLVAVVVAVGAVGCSSGPQTPIQAPPTTVQIEAGVDCRGSERPAPGDAATRADEGVTSGGTCSLAIWVDTAPSSTQTTRGVEAEGENSGGINVPVSMPGASP